MNFVGNEKIKVSSKFILASKSEVRRQIFQKTGLSFIVYPSEVNEEKIKKNYTTKSPAIIASRLSELKALNVGENFLENYTIGFDQICFSQGKIYNKPGNKDLAFKQLCELRGRAHRQYSAISIVKDLKVIWTYVEYAELVMHNLTNEEIVNYINMDNPINSCGSYKFESLGLHLFSKITGSNETIQGFPLIPFLRKIRKLKIYSLK